jgi:endoglucanase
MSGNQRPAVRVNQHAYLPTAPKMATWVSAGTEPMTFTVRRGDGSVLFRGESRPWSETPEPTSGLPVHVLDFSSVRSDGSARIEIGADRSHPFRIAGDAYGELRRDALRVLYLLRSGCVIDDARAPGYGRPAGHIGVAPNRGDTAVAPWTGADAAALYPGWSATGTFDVSGGWYDAGDHGKYTVSGSIALWQLLNVVRLVRSVAEAGSGFESDLLAECRWQLDWLMRMQVPAGQPLAGMAFHRVHGTEWSPLPGWAHLDPTERVLHRPSTAATLHLAAVAATGARIFAPTDPDYGRRLETTARTAYAAARDNPVLIAPDDEGRFGGGPYGDPEVGDDRYWAAVELWLATAEPSFHDDLASCAEHTAAVFDPVGFDFDRVAAPARLDLATSETRPADRDRIHRSVRDAADELLTLQRAQPWGQPYAPSAGWDWGSNGRILNNLVVLAVAHELTADRQYHDGVALGIDYLFGRNALGQSYVTGYGTDRTAHLRTRQFGHDLDPDMPAPPPGALAGGANSTITPGFPQDPRLADLPPQACYLDEPTSETTNDICIRWNAPLVYVATYLDVTSSM